MSRDSNKKTRPGLGHCKYCDASTTLICVVCGRPLIQICYPYDDTETDINHRYKKELDDDWKWVEVMVTTTTDTHYRIEDWSWYCDYCGRASPCCPKCKSMNVESEYSMYDKTEKWEHVTVDDPTNECFITTACCEFKGLPDDCELMTTLRNFRDTYMSEKYSSELQKYYEISPGIIEAIQKRNDSGEIWENTYRSIIEAKELIESGQFEEAYRKYRDTVLDLQNKYT